MLDTVLIIVKNSRSMRKLLLLPIAKTDATVMILFGINKPNGVNMTGQKRLGRKAMLKKSHATSWKSRMYFRYNRYSSPFNFEYSR